MKSYKEINDEIQAEESLKHKTLMKMQEQKAPSHVWQKTLLIATAAEVFSAIHGMAENPSDCDSSSFIVYYFTYTNASCNRFRKQYSKHPFG